MDLFQLIDTVRRRPGMFVEDGSLVALDAFLRGFHFARVDAGVATDADRRFVEGFQPWLQRRHGSDAASTWVEPVRVLADGSGRAPLQRFFELVDDFRQERGELGDGDR